MESKILRVVAVLGIPGLALGVMYLLLRSFGFQFSTISPAWSAAIAILFLLIVGGITAYALHIYRPTGPRPIAPLKSEESLQSEDGKIKLQLYFVLGEGHSGPIELGTFRDHAPAQLLLPQVEETFQLPAPMRTLKEKRVYWVEGSRFLVPTTSYSSQGVKSGHKVILTDLESKELVALIAGSTLDK